MIQRKLNLWLKCFMIVLFFSIFSPSSKLHSMTKSIGYPFDGRLENGIPFPRVFEGYQLRPEDHTYTTPEVIGALLDVIEAVRSEFPDTCDLYIGDFSKPGGGPWYPIHKSHQNGRDVDLGMYAKGNVSLSGFVPMDEENLDLPKTWALVLHLINSQVVEKIFVDTSIQRLLYNYALSQGYSKDFLDKIFQIGSQEYGNSIISHEPNHKDHLHVRFVAPWSELAGRLENPTPAERKIIELAQSSFLPKQVLYYAKDETSVEALSNKLGVSVKELIKWNNLQKMAVIHPGMPIVFYKRGFDVEGVRLAMSLDASIRSKKTSKLALLYNDIPLNLGSPLPPPIRPTFAREKHTFTTISYKVKKGDNLASIAKKLNLSPQEVNALKKSLLTRIKPGKEIKIPVRTTEIAKDSNKNIQVAMASKGLPVFKSNSKDSRADKVEDPSSKKKSAKVSLTPVKPVKRLDNSASAKKGVPSTPVSSSSDKGKPNPLTKKADSGKVSSNSLTISSSKTLPKKETTLSKSQKSKK